MAQTATASTNVFEWNSVNGDHTVNFVVVQAQNDLLIYDEGSSILSQGLLETLSLTPYIVTDSHLTSPVAFSSGKGLLFVVNERLTPIYIKYDSDLETFSITEISVQIRDLIGVDDGLSVEARPTVLSVSHEYNLYNQGWPDYIVHCWDNPRGESGSYTYALPKTRTEVGFYPGNCDLFHACHPSYAEESDKVGSYSPYAITKQSFGNTPAPKGHYIINAFNRNRNEVSGLSVPSSSIKEETILSRPSCNAFFAGRLWMSGISTTFLSGTIYFSQVVKSEEDLGKCYQEQDPTAEDLNAVLATDGGSIEILDAGRIFSLKVLGKSLIVFTSNGVWAITGTSDAGFTAESYDVVKVSSLGTIYPDTIIEAEDRLFYWSFTGIVTIESDANFGGVSAKLITDTTVKTLYNNIPGTSKIKAKSAYDRKNQRILWLYSKDSTIYDTYASKCKNALIFDIRLGAFYEYEFGDISTNNCYVVAAFSPRSNSSSVPINMNVMVGADNIIVGADNVIVTGATTVDAATVADLKYVVFYQDEFVGFAEMSSETFKDWENVDGTGAYYDSTVVTGFENLGDSARRKSTVYVVTHFVRTENEFLEEGSTLYFDRPSSCMLQAIWDYSDSDASNRYSSSNQVYRLRRYADPTGPGAFAYGYSVVSTKNKVRGNGKSLSLKFSNEDGKDYQLLGWEILYEVNKRI